MIKLKRNTMLKRIFIPVLFVLICVATAYAAVTLTVSNEFKYQMGLGAVNCSSDTFKVILMADGFTFNKDTHGTYSDVSASEITNAGGYTVGGYTLTVDSAWAQDNTGDESGLTFVDKTFTASGAAFDTFCAAIIYDDTHANYDFGTSVDVILGCIDFGQNIDVADGNSFQLQDMGYDKE